MNFSLLLHMSEQQLRVGLITGLSENTTTIKGAPFLPRRAARAATELVHVSEAERSG